MHRHRSPIRILIVLMLLSGFGSCCDDVIDFWNIADMRAVVIDMSTRAIVDSSLSIASHEDFRIQILNEPEFIASISSFDFTDYLFSKCYAFSCPEDGLKGMKDPISSLKIFSNNNFGAVSAGEPLNAFVFIQDLQSVEEENSLSVDEFVSGASELQPVFGTRIELGFTMDAPVSSHFFTVEIETVSGHRFTSMTDEISWF